MTDERSFGLGCEPSPPDPRDLPVELAYAEAGIEPAAVLPEFFAWSWMPAVYDQGNTPQCVAYSAGSLKNFQDRRELGSWFVPYFARFFSQIGGTSAGAYIRAALARLLHYGYPEKRLMDRAALHKIQAYYAVPTTETAIKQAIKSFGPLVLGIRWPRSWFKPRANGVLPAPSGGEVGGHAIIAYGWSPNGLRLRNSWGRDWGVGGNCIMPWAYVDRVFEAWRAIDVGD